MSDLLLSSLCSICHNRPHQYRCPRCSTLTCSLPCVKRHKKWAQCNGTRDPAAYVKRAELATPSAIDRDYNYLTSIEREFDRAEKDATVRGVVLVEEGQEGKPRDLAKGEAPLNAAMERCQVIIARAPKGMTRSKHNETSWSKKRHRIHWTVEWIHPDGRKELGMCPETLPVSDAYMQLANAQESERPKKRRRHNPKDDSTASDVLQPLPPNANHLKSSSNPEDPPPTEKTSRNGNGIAPNLIPQTILESKPETDQAKEPNPPAKRPASSSPQPPSSPTASSSLPDASSTFSFYLHAPSLPTSKTVLIPLPPDSTLRSTLPNRLVLEFPTIYVIQNNTTGRQLPDELITEDDFYASAKKELVEVIEGQVDEGANVRGQTGEGKVKGLDEIQGVEVDAKVLTEVLGKDLGGVV